MSKPPEPEGSDETTDPIDPKTDTPADAGNSDATTVIFATEPAAEPTPADLPERRFTAPGFDAGKTEILPSMPDDAATRVIGVSNGVEPGKATPQQIPPRTAGVRLPSANNRSWGWVLALVLVILVIAVVAVLAMLALTKDSAPKASQEDRVRNTIHNYDAAVQNGDLATLRSITCGTERDSYVNYDQRAWDDTYRRVAAARQYPQIASVDAVVVTDDHAEANVTAFMAYAPQTRSTRSIDLQFRDDQWKICQSQTG